MMKTEPSPWYVRWGITFAAGLLIVLAMAFGRDILSQSDAAKVCRILCDGCFLASVLLIGLGLMTFISAEGTFDILSYGILCFAGLFKSRNEKSKTESAVSGEEEPKSRTDFFAYKQSKSGSRSAQWYLVFVGLIYLAFSFLFMFAYHSTR